MNMHKRISPGGIIRSLWFKRGITLLAVFTLLFYISARNIIPQKYNLKEGDVALTDVKAPRDFNDEVATEKKRQAAADAVEEQFVRDYSIKNKSEKAVKDYFETAKNLISSSVGTQEKVEQLKGAGISTLSIDDYENTLKMTADEIEKLSSYLSTEVSNALSGNIKETEKTMIQNELIEKIRNKSFSKNSRELANGIVYGTINANYFPDNEQTLSERDRARKLVPVIVIKRGQNIVQKGEVVTEAHINLMQRAGILERNYSVDIKIYSGVAILIILAIIAAVWFLYKLNREVYEDNSKIFIIAITICLNTLFILGLNVISGYLIPAAFTSILISLIFKSTVSLMVGIFPILITAFITGFNYEIILIAVFNTLVGTLFSNTASQRNNVIFSGFYVGILNALIILSFGLINNIGLAQMSINSAQGLASGLLAAVLAVGILPLFEQLFNILTPIKLLELSNPNQPLLKKMLFEAPGTYHHSILVGNLSEAACEEIGANSLLARVGAYYHDIGKIKRPYFFKENQITNDNPHDKITPKLSTLIITSHVKDGYEMADKFRLPEEIKDIILEHHGTTLVKYFYVMALNDGNQVVEENSFRYEGPKPKTKESAIVMLADSVEAAVRSLNNPTLEDIQGMVNKIVKEKIDDEQLELADLTLRDIGNIKQAFIKVLQGIFHRRIEYPEITEDTKGKEE